MVATMVDIMEIVLSMTCYGITLFLIITHIMDTDTVMDIARFMAMLLHSLV